MYKYFKVVRNSINKISTWESKGLSNEKISSINASRSATEPNLEYDNARIKLRFREGLLSQDKVTYNHGPMLNIYIVYRLTPDTKDSGITLENCLFGAVKLSKSNIIDAYKYSGYGIGFDSRGSFLHPSGGFGKNVIIFGADMSSSVHTNNKARSILVCGKDFIQGIANTTIYAEKMYSTSFTVDNKKFCLILHYNLDERPPLLKGLLDIMDKAQFQNILL